MQSPQYPRARFPDHPACENFEWTTVHRKLPATASHSASNCGERSGRAVEEALRRLEVSALSIAQGVLGRNHGMPAIRLCARHDIAPNSAPDRRTIQYRLLLLASSS